MVPKRTVALERKHNMREILASAAALQVSLCALLMASTGCGGDGSLAESSAATTAPYTGGNPASVDNTASQIFEDDPKVEVRINNNGAAITDEVLPTLAAAYGLGDMQLSDQQLSSGTAPGLVTALMPCHSSSARFTINMRDVEVRAPILPGNVQLVFDPGKAVKADLDLPQFISEFELEFNWPKDNTSWVCGAFPDILIKVNVNVFGAFADLDLTLEDANSGGVAVKSIDNFEVSVSSVSFDSGFLTAITNLGLSAADLFGGSCGSLTSCINQAVEDNLSGRSPIKDALSDAIEDAISQASTLSGAVNLGVAEIDYAVSLSSVASNDAKDRLNVKWDVDVSSNRADASCAVGLSRAAYTNPSDLSTSDDLEVVLPFRKISDLFYTVAKQGKLCAPFSYTTKAGTAQVSVKPNGSFRVSSVNGNLLSITIPVKIEANFGGTAAITGSLVVNGRVKPICGGGIQLVPTKADLTGLTGTMSYSIPGGGVVTMSAASFIASNEAAAETAIMNALLPGLTLVPSSFGLSAVGRYVSIGEVLSDSASLTMGLNLLDEDPYCD